MITNTVTFNNSSLTFGGSNPLLFSGAATLGGTNNTLTVTNTAVTNFDGVISTAAGAAGNLTKAGSGTLVLSGANTFTGQTFINAGVIQVQNNTALGAAAGGTAVVAGTGAAVQILGSTLNVGKAIILNGTGISGGGAIENLIGGNNTWSGNIFLNTVSNIGADGGTTLTQNTGAISGPGNLTTVGVGTVSLSGANTYVGNTVVSTGVAVVANATGLGLPAGGRSASAASLRLCRSPGGITVGGKALTLNGTGFGNNGVLPQGALVNLAGTNFWAGGITLTGSIVLGGGNGVPLPTTASTGTLIGAIAGTLNVSGVVGGSDLAKVGAGAVTLLNANTFTGQTIVLGGTLTLSNTNVSTAATTVAGAAVGGVFTAGVLDLNLYGTTATKRPSASIKAGR